MDLFHRTVTSRTQWGDSQQSFVVSVDMADAFHDIGVRVSFSYPDLVIRDVVPRMDRTPYPICTSALQHLQGCVGLKVQAGLQLLMNRSIGGVDGCRHLTQLVLDACHAAVQGLLAIQASGADRGPRHLPTEEKLSVLEGRGLSLRNSCRAYATPAGVLD